ncbi:Zn(2)-C6 fungal-type domain-containing protein [Fusarium sp. LHS14.1]|nr:Zn(2)-C6 fungal-type domain-containing protein [Fusarium sp. LHS14.1]
MKDPGSVPSSNKPRFRRAYARKVRTGCITWIRHLKCDEEKPICLRCRNDGVKCDGYAPTNKAKDEHPKAPVQRSQPLSVTGVSHLVSDVPLERCYFHHFYHWTCKQLSNSPETTNFWIQHVLPLSHASEPIKNAIIAVGAAHRFFMAGYDTHSPQRMEFLTTQYNKAVSRIIPHMSIDSVHNIHCTLISCLLFIAFEGISGRHGESIRHLRAGNRLLTLPALTSVEDGCVMTMKLNEIFSHLSFEASIFMDDAILPDMRQSWSAATANANIDISSRPFQNLDEASYELRQLGLNFAKITRVDFKQSLDASDSLQLSEDEETEAQHDDTEADALFEELKRRFKEWMSRFDLTKKTLEHLQYPQTISQQLLSLTVAQKFWCMNMYFAPEPYLDPQADPEADFLDAAESLVKEICHPNHFTFSFDGDLVSNLSFVVRVCSGMDRRHRALNLLRLLNRREGVWDSREIVEMHEATLSLHDYAAWYERDVPGGIPGYIAELSKILKS